MGMVSNVKNQLQILKETGWEDLLEEVSTLCLENIIDIPKYGR